jgi:hypothetical protein
MRVTTVHCDRCKDEIPRTTADDTSRGIAVIDRAVRPEGLDLCDTCYAKIREFIRNSR